MADTVRALSALQTLYQDNATGAISEQDLRDGFYSSLGVIPYAAKTANYTATESDEFIAVDATSGAVTITLPAVATTRAGKVYTVKKTDTSANAVIIDGNSSETIDGDTTQILFTQYAFVTIVNTGAAWLVVNQRGLNSGHTFIATASATVANTASETTVIGSGIGTLTLPANFHRVGKTIRLTASGVLGDTGTPTLNIKFKYGSTTIVSTGAATLTTGLTNVGWRLVVDLTCRTVGASGTVIAQGLFTYDNGTAQVEALAATTTTTVDTTASQAVNVTAQWGAADSSNTITCSNLAIEILR